MNNFKDTNIREDIKNTITKELGFKEQTLIQEKTIPLIKEGKDVLGESATGSGKTLAFGIGAVETAEPKKGIQVLIITPTRELAEQVKNNIVQIKGKDLKVTSIYGGVAINPQMENLKRSEIVIATPGRLKDHIQRKSINLSNVKMLVLDEADRMLDMGFIEDIEDIIKKCPKNRQTLFFSATLPPIIQKLSSKYMKDPEKISATKEVDPSKLKQEYYDVPGNMKFSLLVHLLKEETSGLVIVFCNTRNTTDVVVKNLRSNGIEASVLHGGHTQNRRNQAMDIFKKGKKQVLVCTDVAARGIHVENISHIYNYDIPNDPTDYVHRIGRTARAGKEGKVINLLSRNDHDYFSKVIERNKTFKIEKIEKPYIEKIELKRDNQRRNFGGKKGGYKGKNNRSKGKFFNKIKGRNKN
ncbi:MAG: DEAD/DEAH box helicase [Nanobdellota archaeon]